MMDVAQKEDLLITCKSGVTIRMKVSDISSQGRATQGVKLIRIDEGDEIAAITKIDVAEVEEITGAIVGPETTNLPENTSEGEDPLQS